MNERIKELAEQAGLRFTQLMSNPMVPVVDGKETDLEKFAELIVGECLSIVKSNTYGPAGEYDYSYSDENAAADDRAETIYKDIKQHFGVEE